MVNDPTLDMATRSDKGDGQCRNMLSFDVNFDISVLPTKMCRDDILRVLNAKFQQFGRNGMISVARSTKCGDESLHM